MRLFLLAAVVLPFHLLTGAESNVPAVKSVEPPLGYAGTPAPPPDYAQRVNWVLFPAAGTDSAEADLFYVYPTVTADRKNPLMHWEEPQLRDKTRNIALQQCALFDGVARIYAPFCRQLEFFRAMEALRGNRETAAGFRPGEEDVKAAFDYYWNHENRGRRPFFLLGHSQGAMELFALMRDRFQDPAVRERLVAAYLIGMPLTDTMLKAAPHLRFARSACDTGVIVVYNTESADAEPSPFTGAGVLCINPLNWHTDATAAAPEENLGAQLYDWTNGEVRKVPAFCGARIDPERGALIVDPGPGKYDSAALGRGIYHMNDLYFFFENLKKNIADRLAAYRSTASD